MSRLISLCAGLWSGAWGSLALSLLSAAIAGTGTGFLVHRLDQAAMLKLQLSDAKAAGAALADRLARQKAADRDNLDAAVGEARAQQKIVRETFIVTKEIPAHVPDVRACIPNGLVRVLDAAATGDDPANRGLPASESDDACAPLSWRDFAADIADDYGIGRQNAEQLNALEADIRTLDGEGSSP